MISLDFECSSSVLIQKLHQTKSTAILKSFQINPLFKGCDFSIVKVFLFINVFFILNLMILNFKCYLQSFSQHRHFDQRE